MTRTRGLSFGLVLVVILVTACCVENVLAKNPVSYSTEFVLPLLHETYMQDRRSAASIAKEAGGTLEDMSREYGKVEKRWAKVWEAWKKIGEAEERWIEAARSHEDTGPAMEDIHDAYCELQTVWPPNAPAMPSDLWACLNCGEDWWME